MEKEGERRRKGEDKWRGRVEERMREDRGRGRRMRERRWRKCMKRRRKREGK